MCSTSDNYSRFDSRYNVLSMGGGGELYDHLKSMRIFILTTNKSSKNHEESGYDLDLDMLIISYCNRMFQYNMWAVGKKNHLRPIYLNFASL
jgi:hypothetical protein